MFDESFNLMRKEVEKHMANSTKEMLVWNCWVVRREKVIWVSKGRVQFKSGKSLYTNLSHDCYNDFEIRSRGPLKYVIWLKDFWIILKLTSQYTCSYSLLSLHTIYTLRKRKHGLC